RLQLPACSDANDSFAQRLHTEILINCIQYAEDILLQLPSPIKLLPYSSHFKHGCAITALTIKTAVQTNDIQLMLLCQAHQCKHTLSRKQRNSIHNLAMNVINSFGLQDTDVVSISKQVNINMTL
ncbi:hypothetical protein KI387_026803, partial [Taxus chinensis]